MEQKLEEEKSEDEILLASEENKDFRNRLATVTKEGKRNWIFPKKPSGRFYNARSILTIFLLAFLFGSPFIKINEQQFLLFNFPDRTFVLFGLPFGPHDFHIFVLAMIATIVFIILFTAVFGRVFCGWICPQTIFMEMVFRKIEYWIEGDFREQIKLKAAPWTTNKILKKSSKQIIFYSISFVITNFFLAYIIGMDKLLTIVSQPPSANLKGFIAILFFSGAFYFVFSYFREQACTVVCPYGRLQGVLLDQDSIVVAYDYKRGEPRGKIKKSEVETKKGDCIDCHLCVDVCPTGIDIRNGIQLECVNCTACIDACDDVMTKVKRPKGLIRYASLNGIEKGTKLKFTSRVIGYSILLVVLLSVIGYLLATRTNFSINVLRTPGLLFQEQPNDMISNLYDLNIINKTFASTSIDLKLKNLDGELKLVGNKIELGPQEIDDAKFIIILPKSELEKMNTPITIAVYGDGKLLEEINTSFLGPVKHKIEDEENEKD